jgi:hypothetical protein
MKRPLSMFNPWLNRTDDLLPLKPVPYSIYLRFEVSVGIIKIKLWTVVVNGSQSLEVVSLCHLTDCFADW